MNIPLHGYVIRALEKLNHAPHLWVTPVYVSRQQKKRKETSKSPRLNKDVTQSFQSITGTFLHCVHSLYPCILPSLNKIASKQSNLTTNPTIKLYMLMDYLHTNLKAIILYHSSYMILIIVSDAAFLVPTQSRSR